MSVEDAANELVRRLRADLTDIEVHTPDLTQWLDNLPSGSMTVNLGNQDLPDFAGKPMTDEDGNRIGTVEGAHITPEGEIHISARFGS